MHTIEALLTTADTQFHKIYTHTQQVLHKIRADRAMPSMLDGILVDHYGILTPIHQIANISAPDALTLLIKPWEKKMLTPIERAIVKRGLYDLVPQHQGEQLRINLPPLTQERREAIVKEVASKAEEGKVQLRNERKNIKNHLKKLGKEEHLSEDAVKQAEEKLQKLTDTYIGKVTTLYEAKAQALLHI